MTAYEIILKEQNDWASRKQKPRHLTYHAKGYLADLGSNLYQPLCEAAKKMFEAGAGGESGPAAGTQELSQKGAPAHMLSLCSSSALVCNLFHPFYQTKEFAPILSALGADLPARSMRFEATHPCVKGMPPHLDVEFQGTEQVVAIEAKFCEPYRPLHGAKKPVQQVYCDLLDGKIGRPRCAKVARQLGSDWKPLRLDAGQLLKHICGLEKAYAGAYELLYLYYDPGLDLPEAKQHGEELQYFIEAVGSEVRVRAVTYQEVFARLEAEAGADAAHLDYLRDRYFPTAATQAVR
jgi:hypothetical protein